MRAPAHPRRIFGILLALGALLALPGTAWGKEGSSLAFRLTGSNGYRITVASQGATAFLSATQPGGPRRRQVASSTYIARGKVSPAAIDASFGDLGKVAMRFHPSGTVTHGKPRRGCRGPDRFTIRSGVFIGTLRFRGEDGYTSVEAHRVKGKVTTPLSLSCAGGFSEAGSRPKAGQGNAKRTTLFAGWHSGVKAMYFEAIAQHGKARFLAATEQTEGSLAIYRFASALASPLTFAFGSTLGFASITPPPPFSGTGSLQRNADGSRAWTGSLAVSFPGDPSVPFTGPQFKTQLTRSW